MYLKTTKVNQNNKESVAAKEYWKLEDSHTTTYKEPKHFVDVILLFIKLSFAKKILEFGCGSGRNLNQINDFFEKQIVDENFYLLKGIDINQNLIEYGKTNFSINLELIVGDENSIKKEKNNFYDLIFTVSVLDHFPDPLITIKELIKKTKRYIIFIEPFNPDIKKTEKIENISTIWKKQSTNQATPYTYFHNYKSYFKQNKLDIVCELPLPTHLGKIGPFYKLFLVQKITNKTHIFDKKFLIEELQKTAILTNIRNASSYLAKLNKSVSELKQQQEQNTQQHQTIKNLNQEVVTKDKKINQFNQDPINKQQEIHQLASHLKQQQEQNTQQHQTIKNLNQEVVTKDKKINQFNQDLINKQQEIHQLASHLKQQQEQNTQQHQTIKNLNQEVVTKDKKIDQISSVNSKFSELIKTELSNTYNNKLGDLFLKGTKSISAFMKLPYEIYKFRNNIKQKIPKILGDKTFDLFIKNFCSQSIEEITKFLDGLNISNKIKSDAYTALSKYFRKKKDFNKHVQFADLAYKTDPKLYRRKFLMLAHAKNQDYQNFNFLFLTLDKDRDLTEFEQSEIFTIHQHLNKLKINAVNNTNEYIDKFYKSDLKFIIKEILIQNKDKSKISRKLIEVSKIFYEYQLFTESYLLAKEATSNCFDYFTVFWFVKYAEKLLLDQEAKNILIKFDNLLKKNPKLCTEQQLNNLKDSKTYQLILENLIPDKKNVTYNPIKKNICYILHNAITYSSGGYANRSHQIAIALKKKNFNPIMISRPGYPFDINVSQTNEIGQKRKEEQFIDGIFYKTIPNPSIKKFKFVDYVKLSSDIIEKILFQHKPSFVIAASNYQNAFPALIAARKLGIPFIYDIRGFWEITRESREPDFAKTITHKVYRLMENIIANYSDKVFTLNQDMKNFLIDNGIDEQKIDLMPNGCDPDQFIRQNHRNDELVNTYQIPPDTIVIGFIGSFVDYEGLDDLAEACGILKKKGYQFRLLLVGNENVSDNEKGSIHDQITTIAKKNNFYDWLIMPGRIHKDEVKKYYSLIDICPFPRKAVKVCELVTPLKPFEALSMEKAVIVSSVAPLREIIEDKKNGLIFEKENIEDLSNKIISLIKDNDLKKNIERNGRKLIINIFNWDQSLKLFIKLISFK